MASESGDQAKNRDQGHRNHFRLLGEEGRSWSGREPNTLFQNRGADASGGVRFDEVGNVLGVYLRLDSRGAATADLDGDGDLDLAVYNRNNPTIKIYRNDTPVQGNLALIDLRGTAGEPLAAGAQAVLSCAGRDQLRQVELGSGFLAQSAPTLHFGLGGCPRIDLIEVRWPSGAVGRWTDLPVDHRLVLTEGLSEVESSPLRSRNYNRDELAPAAGELSADRPALSFAHVDGSGELDLADFDNGTVVLNFWATWCTACVAEMPDLEALYRRFASRGVRFVGISLDEGRPASAVQDFLTERGVTYEQVWGEVEQQQPFASLGSSPPGAVPMTAVIHRGTVRDVRVGKIERDELGELLERLLG